MLKKKITFLFEIQTELEFLYLPSNPRLQANFFFFSVKIEYLTGGSLWTLSDKRAQLWLFPLPF